jgi:hypothetical protein
MSELHGYIKGPVKIADIYIEEFGFSLVVDTEMNGKHQTFRVSMNKSHRDGDQRRALAPALHELARKMDAYADGLLFWDAYWDGDEDDE